MQILFNSNKIFLKFYLLFTNLHCGCYLSVRKYVAFNVSDERGGGFF